MRRDFVGCKNNLNRSSAEVSFIVRGVSVWRCFDKWEEKNGEAMVALLCDWSAMGMLGE